MSRHPDMGRRIVRVMERMEGVTSMALQVGDLSLEQVMEKVYNLY